MVGRSRHDKIRIVLQQPGGQILFQAFRHQRQCRTSAEAGLHPADVGAVTGVGKTAEMPAGNSHGIVMHGDLDAVVLKHRACRHKLPPDIGHKLAWQVGCRGGSRSITCASRPGRKAARPVSLR